jgi:Rrf2 family protein
MFSQTLEYALRAVVCLAQEDPKPLTTQQIAEVTRVTPSYLSKVLQSLVRANLIGATRGAGGGYVLNVRPTDLTILHVANAIDPLKRITTCPLGLKSHGANLCPLHRRLDRVIADAEEAFRKTSIAELIDSSHQHAPLCERGLVEIDSNK